MTKYPYKYVARGKWKGGQIDVTILMSTIEDLPIGEQIRSIAKTLKAACPEIHRKADPYPTLRMTKCTDEEICYEITQGGDLEGVDHGSKANSM